MWEKEINITRYTVVKMRLGSSPTRRICTTVINESSTVSAVWGDNVSVCGLQIVNCIKIYSHIINQAFKEGSRAKCQKNPADHGNLDIRRIWARVRETVHHRIGLYIQTYVTINWLHSTPQIYAGVTIGKIFCNHNELNDKWCHTNTPTAQCILDVH